MARRVSTKSSVVAVATKARKQKLVQQLKEIPIPTYVCQKLGVPKATYYKWRKTDDAFRAASDEAILTGKLSINDVAKSQLVKLINNGDYRSISFWLKHNDPDFNPKLTLEIQSTKREYDPAQLKEMEQAMLKAGLVGVSLAHQEMERKFREFMDKEQQSEESKEDYLTEPATEGVKRDSVRKGGIKIADLPLRKKTK